MAAVRPIRAKSVFRKPPIFCNVKKPMIPAGTRAAPKIRKSRFPFFVLSFSSELFNIFKISTVQIYLRLTSRKISQERTAKTRAMISPPQPTENAVSCVFKKMFNDVQHKNAKGTDKISPSKAAI